jgi:hypothetical protein
MYLYVDDSAPAVANHVRYSSWEVISGLAGGAPGGTPSGSGIMPASGTGLNSSYYWSMRKSATADATARPWILFADNRTFYLFVQTGDAASTYYGYMYGDFYSFVRNDIYNCTTIGGNSDSAATAASYSFEYAAQSIVGIQAHGFQRAYHGLGLAVLNTGKFASALGTLGQGYGVIPFPNPEDGGAYFHQYFLYDPTTSPTGNIRGKMRGMWQFLHPLASVSDGQIFQGVGDLAGRTFMVVKLLQNQTNTQGMTCIEISNTLDTNT